MKALETGKLDKIIGLRNPLDLSPMASDEIFDLCLRAMLEDEHIAAAIISAVPLTWMMQTLPPGEGYNESIYSEGSIVSRLIRIKKEYEKPFICVIDCGKEYDPMAEALEAGGVPIFRTADRAVRLLRKIIFHSVRKPDIW
jgi:acyl-CoA synthetase (NDP forming)